MHFNKAKFFQIAVTFTTVGILLAVILFIVFSSEPTVGLIIGIIGGLTIALLIAFASKKYANFKKDNKEGGSNSDINSSIGHVINNWLKLSLSDEKCQKLGANIENAAKGVIVSWSLFAAIAIALSVALYYATILQAKHMEAQNSIVTTQNRLACEQNNLSDKANRLDLYQLNLPIYTSTVHELRSLGDTFKDSLSRTEVCAEKGSIENNIEHCNDADETMMHEVNSDYRLRANSAFLETKEPTSLYKSWKEEYKYILRNLKPILNSDLAQPYKKYRVALEKLSVYTDEEIARLNKKIIDERNDIEMGFEDCSVFKINPPE